MLKWVITIQFLYFKLRETFITTFSIYSHEKV